jgi:hypothetical protein
MSALPATAVGVDCVYTPVATRLAAYARSVQIVVFNLL